MDKIDEKILALLKEDSRMSFTKISAKTGLSESAIRRRIKKLVNSGIIKKFTIQTKQTGLGAIVWVSVINPPSLPEISKEINKLPNVKNVYEVSGPYDICAILRAENIENLNQCVDQIRKIKSIHKTETIIIMKTVEKSAKETN